jgi:integrase
MFSTGMRVGTLLNLKVKDCELKHNVKTNMDYYLIHIQADYTKSQKNRTVPVVIPRANKLLKDYLTHLKPEDILFPYSHQGISKSLKQACMESKIRTKPTKKLVTPHVLRKSAAIYLLNKKYSIDQVKAMLGHKPSSTVIDRYVNYLGLGFENEINLVQSDSYEKVKSELENVKSQMLVMQRQKDNSDKKIEGIEKKMELLIKAQVVNSA